MSAQSDTVNLDEQTMMPLAGQLMIPDCTADDARLHRA